MNYSIEPQQRFVDRTCPSVPVSGIITGAVRAGNEIYSVYCGDPWFTLHVPAAQEAPAPRTTDIAGNFFTPTFISPQTPYLLFIPAHEPWYGPLLGRLRYNSTRIPIIQRGDKKWMLRADVMDEWRALELNLRAVVAAMMELTVVEYPKEMSPFGYPDRFGYMESYRSANAARQVALRSITGFLPLIGHLSMFFLLLRICDRENWREDVCKKSGVHPQWFAHLENSAAGDFNIPRIGGLFDLCLPPNTNPSSLERTQMDTIIGAIIKYSLPIPMYFSWGSIDSWPTVPLPHSLKKLEFIPDHLEIRYLRTIPGRVAFSPWTRTWYADVTKFSTCRESHPFTHFPSSTAHPAERFAAAPFPVEQYSGQLPGEELDQFLSRRDSVNRDRAAHENTDDTNLRIQREELAKKEDVPWDHGARVYVWEISNGHYIRRLAKPVDYNAIWADYSPTMRIYDAFTNEWDVCEALGRDSFDAPSPSWAADNDLEVEVPREMLPEKPNATRAGAHTSEADLSRVHPSPPLIGKASHYAGIGETVQDIVYLRFGCMVGSKTFPTTTTHEALPKDNVVAKTLGDKDIQLPSPDKLHCLKRFLAECVQAGKDGNLEKIHHALLDFHNTSSRIHSPWNIDVRTIRSPHEVLYLLQECDDPGPLSIILYSATTVLEIVRQNWGPRIPHIAQRLLARGIGFGLSVRRKQPSPRTISLGFDFGAPGIY
ncbi:hypothetical protein B0H11DRAFT_2365734 [Mycena galericulata]|nr:hypothetical protein B0H11DRAFT_2298150 [Mycena galericulata]KAJ7501700.1 hypothetical protein B0H11DRAFT_2275263 [Mycena galericulata]KAJ7502364.1 hypothetical protein B0H11DRAFT_2365734 [Mycena galericulata]